jgi:hypothetical protein
MLATVAPVGTTPPTTERVAMVVMLVNETLRLAPAMSLNKHHRCRKDKQGG